MTGTSLRNQLQFTLFGPSALQIDDTTMKDVSEDADGARVGSWQTVWLFPHLAVVYAIVRFVTPWLAEWTRETVLPLFQHPTSLSRFEFFFSHLLLFSFTPAFVGGLANASFKHKAAEFVWIPPAVILTYKFFTFPGASVFQNQFSVAFHQYFSSGFSIPEVRSWHELFLVAGTTADMWRGMSQQQFTAPFYAGIGYALAEWIGHRTELSEKIAQKVRSC